MITTHRINGDAYRLLSHGQRLSAFFRFLFFFDGDHELSLVKPAARTDAVRDVRGAALGALGQAGKLEPFPVGPARIASRGGMMFLWICHGESPLTL